MKMLDCYRKLNRARNPLKSLLLNQLFNVKKYIKSPTTKNMKKKHS